MSDPLFWSLDSAAIADEIRRAQYSVCYVTAPGNSSRTGECNGGSGHTDRT